MALTFTRRTGIAAVTTVAVVAAVATGTYVSRQDRNEPRRVIQK